MFSDTDGIDTTNDSPYTHINILARLGQYMGIIAPGTANRTNEEGKNIRLYDRWGKDIDTNTEVPGRTDSQ